MIGERSRRIGVDGRENSGELALVQEEFIQGADEEDLLQPGVQVSFGGGFDALLDLVG